MHYLPFHLVVAADLASEKVFSMAVDTFVKFGTKFGQHFFVL